MSQTTQLLNTLKKCLKAKGVTYRQLGKELDLSEASVKRLFSEQSFSIKRLEEICNILELNFYDLAKLSADAEAVPSVLTIEQETQLSKNHKLLVFFYLLLNGRDPQSIVNDYKISERESLKFLLQLDKLSLIDLYPNNQIKLRTRKSIIWRKDGPIRKQYEKQIKMEFLNSPFDNTDERLRFESGKLPHGVASVLLKKIDKLFKEFGELTEIDNALPQESSYNTGLLIAFRPWVFSLVKDLKK